MSVIVDLMKGDASKLDAGKKSAAPALRKQLQVLITKCGAMRKAVLAAGKAVPVKKRVKKEKESDEEVAEVAENTEVAAEETVVKKPRGRKKKTVEIVVPESE